MKTISVTVNDDLFQAVDRTTETLHITRSTFMRHALQMAIHRQQTAQQEERHRQGYLKQPVEDGEFSDWEDEQEWGD
ncbi:MAG: CopG family transcriptional regulator [bacterium]|nr:CopG family transcriptional regulator [bacterium]